MLKKLLVGAALAASLAGVLYGASAGKSAANAALPTTSQMAPFGIAFSNPQGAIPNAADGAAAAIAASTAANASVLGTHYYHCVDPNASPAIDQDYWVVSVDPSNVRVHGIPGQPDPKPATWAIVLVDPATGDAMQEFYSNN